MRKKISHNSVFQILSAKEKLLVWFRRNKRNLPFRVKKDPYRIWVSEVMLQQTRMIVMLPLYEKFIQRFPNIKSLSNAKDKEVLFFWRGLGYYSRAYNLRKGAKFVMDSFDGEMPKDLESLLKIPGVGPYTARAISSIAFGKKHAVLDGNVKRVIARIYQFEKPINVPSSLKYLQNLADTFLNEDSPGDHNEAMMELGATICGKKPICEICPLSAICLSKKHFKENEIPFTQKEKSNIRIEIHFLFLSHNGKFLFVKGKNRRFFKSIFTPPFLIFGKNLPDSYKNDPQFENFFLSKRRKEHAINANHTITHHNIILKASNVKLDSEVSVKNYESKWVRFNSLEKEFHSSIAKKFIQSGLKSDLVFKPN